MKAQPPGPPSPHFASALNHMGAVLLQRGDLDEDVSYFTKALENNPDHAGAYNNMGDALTRMGNLDEAIS